MTSLGRKSEIGFIGAGVVGGSLAIGLSSHGYRVVAAASRSFSSAQTLAERIPGCEPHRSGQEVADIADVVFITTPDDAIEVVASAISWRPGRAAVHCSGAASLDVLEHPAQQGAVPGAFHPLQAFSSLENGAKSLPGATFGIEGNDQMRAFLSEMALAIGGNPIFLKSEDKPLYHLTGVMMGNLLTALAATAAQLWENLGLTRAEGVNALAPMMRQVSANLESMGVPGAVAGPFARGDIGTVRKHLHALQTRAPEVLPLYCELALAALPFGLEKQRLTPERADEIRELVEAVKTNVGNRD